MLGGLVAFKQCGKTISDRQEQKTNEQGTIDTFFHDILMIVILLYWYYSF